ncbi:CapA family protein [Dehalobacter sp. DCM]|uniref:CapA family protein n=1 Tax=Dehalobacter sp. DCM TaxID=2907827 RepID=UPI003081F276|nr:CapA family protein [Dehalobacter sp. DCM]
MKKAVGLLSALVLVLTLFGCGTGGNQNKVPENGTPGNGQPETNNQTNSAPYVDISISSVGDILIHNTLYMAAYDSASNSYDFRSQYRYVTPYLETADITIANLETTLAGPEKGYSGYPRFNSPDSLVDALKDAGIDILTGANNHRLDEGVSGFYRTIDTVRNEGLDIIGVKSEQKDKTYVIKEIKGIPVAFLNFGYGFKHSDGSLDINGLLLPMDMSGLMDTFDPNDPEQSVTAIKNRVDEVRREGAQLVILCLHWGNEYQRTPDQFQQDLASELATYGVDAIFGGHPHVLQPVVYLSNANGGKVPVFYSQGNFISDQRLETVDDIHTERGMIANVTFRVYPDKTKKVMNTQTVPTWVNKKRINGKLVYEVIPANDALASPDKFPLITNADLDRIRSCVEGVRSLVLIDEPIDPTT